jgi:hypothetical protein
MPATAHGTAPPATRAACDGCRTVTAVRAYTRPEAGQYQLCRRCHPDHLNHGTETR